MKSTSMSRRNNPNHTHQDSPSPSPSASLSASKLALSLSLPTLLQCSIPQQQYPHLESIIKLMNEYLSKCVKNRQYIQAQKAKDKIQQAHLCIKKRNANYVNEKLMQNMRKIQQKHQEEKLVFQHQWEMRVNVAEEKFNEQIQKKSKSNQEEIMKLRDQIELALPIHSSPDQKLKSLKNQQRHMAERGNFLEAQRIKDEIEQREIALDQKHKKLRQSNIRSMLIQLEQKQEKDMRQRLKQKKTVVDQIIKEKNKKFKELEERQNKQLREIKWMATEQMRLIK